MSDWSKVCEAFNLSLTEVMSVLGGDAPRRKVRRAAALRPSVTAVSDSESEVSVSSFTKDNFANAKARAFASEHGFSVEDVTGTGKNGKVKLSDLKKLLPPKKRGRKPKAKAAVSLDVVDSLAASDSVALKTPVLPKGKRVKDPNHPKHPSTAWMFFLNANRAGLREKNPDAKMTEITKLASVKWKATSVSDRAPWVAKAVADKARYAAEMSSYEAPEPVFVLPKKKRKKSPVKKATNPWMAYLNAHRDQLRAAHPEVKMTEITKMASIAYKALTDTERVPWVAIAETDKVRYAKELAEYNAKQSPSASPEEPKAQQAKKAKKAKKAPKAQHASEAQQAKKVTQAKKAPKAQQAQQAKKAPEAQQVEESVVFDDAASVQFEESFDIGADSDDDELDEDEAVEFEWQGNTYWRTWDGHVMDDPEGAAVGRWDDESESIVFTD